MYYLNSRYYDPETGRFINADDISILNTTKSVINGLNLYAYCKNNPIMNIDTNGNWSWKNFFGWVFVGVEIAVASIAIAYGVVASISGNDLLSSSLIGFGTGVISEIITSTTQNLDNSIQIAINGFKGGVIGGTAGFVAGGIGLMGEYYGNILGNTLSNMTILSSGIKLSKIINPSIIISLISTMSSIVAGIGSGILIQNLFYNENDMYENATNSLKDEIKSIIYEIFRYFALQ